MPCWFLNIQCPKVPSHDLHAVVPQILESLGTLSPSKTETYGPDTTFTFAAGTLDAGNLSKPDLSE